MSQDCLPGQELQNEHTTNSILMSFEIPISLWVGGGRAPTFWDGGEVNGMACSLVLACQLKQPISYFFGGALV